MKLYYWILTDEQNNFILDTILKSNTSPGEQYIQITKEQYNQLIKERYEK